MRTPNAISNKQPNFMKPNTWKGQTPLNCAAAGVHEGVLKILLEKKVVNPGGGDLTGHHSSGRLRDGMGGSKDPFVTKGRQS